MLVTYIMSIYVVKYIYFSNLDAVVYGVKYVSIVLDTFVNFDISFWWIQWRDMFVLFTWIANEAMANVWSKGIIGKVVITNYLFCQH